MLPGRQKSRPLAPHHRFLIAMHSPNGVVKTGLRVCPPEKEARKLREELRTRFSLVRFERKNRGIAAISRDFQDNAGRFLCTSDLLVEREEFELSLPFLEPARARTCGGC